MKVKDRRDYLLNEKPHLRVFLSLQILIFLSFSLLFGAFFKKKQKNFPVHTTSLLPRLVSSGWVFNSFSLMSPSFDVTHRMHRGTWEVLTSAHNSNNICRQDKQQNQRRNSPSTTSTIPPRPLLFFFFLFTSSVFYHGATSSALSHIECCMINSDKMGADNRWSSSSKWWRLQYLAKKHHE